MFAARIFQRAFVKAHANDANMCAPLMGENERER